MCSHIERALVAGLAAVAIAGRGFTQTKPREGSSEATNETAKKSAFLVGAGSKECLAEIARAPLSKEGAQIVRPASGVESVSKYIRNQNPRLLESGGPPDAQLVFGQILDRHQHREHHLNRGLFFFDSLQEALIVFGDKGRVVVGENGDVCLKMIFRIVERPCDQTWAGDVLCPARRQACQQSVAGQQPQKVRGVIDVVHVRTPPPTNSARHRIRSCSQG